MDLVMWLCDEWVMWAADRKCWRFHHGGGLQLRGKHLNRSRLTVNTGAVLTVLTSTWVVNSVNGCVCLRVFAWRRESLDPQKEEKRQPWLIPQGKHQRTTGWAPQRTTSCAWTVKLMIQEFCSCCPKNFDQTIKLTSMNRCAPVKLAG